MAKIRKKIILFITLLILIVFVIYNLELIIYGIRQGKGQLEILVNTVSTDEIIADSNFPDSLKNKLNLINKAKAFALSDLEMKGNDNYTTVYDQKGKTVLWNVTGCKPYSFEPYSWYFPIVGKVSYKGFFNYSLALKEEERLKTLGYDTRIRPVGAWSTLGWFKDPIMSNMLYRAEGDLVETIFHELTHTTLWVEDSVDFNENLASFVAFHATIKFLAVEYGEESDELITYIDKFRDQQKYRDHFIRGKEKLQFLYNNFADLKDEQRKDSLKRDLINEIVKNLDTISFKTYRYSQIFKDKPLPNNSYFMYFQRYYNMDDILNAYFMSVDYDVRRFLQLMIEMNS